MPFNSEHLRRQLWFGLVVMCSVIVQTSIIRSIPWPPGHANLLLVVVVFGVVAYGLPVVLPWVVAGGLVYDLYTANGFGVGAVSLAAAAAVVSLCASQIVTNRSLVSLLALGVIGHVTFTAFEISVTWLILRFGWSAWSWSLSGGFPWLAVETGQLAFELLPLGVLFLISRGTIRDAVLHPS